MSPPTPTDWLAALRARLAADLKQALRRRDRGAMALLRSVMSALDNAEAVPVEPTRDALPVKGLRATEAPRRVLDRATARAVIEAEIRERAEAARAYRELGRDADATRFEAEVDRLRPYLELIEAPAISSAPS